MVSCGDLATLDLPFLMSGSRVLSSLVERRRPPMLKRAHENGELSDARELKVSQN